MLPVEVHVFGVADGMFRFRVYIEQSFDSPSSDDMLVDDFFRIFGSDLGVKSIVGNDFHDRTFLAKAETTYGDDFHFTGYSVLFDSFQKIVRNTLTGRCFTTCTSADKYLKMLCTGG